MMIIMMMMRKSASAPRAGLISDISAELHHLTKGSSCYYLNALNFMGMMMVMVVMMVMMILQKAPPATI